MPNQDVDGHGNFPEEVKSNSGLERWTGGEENGESEVRKGTQDKQKSRWRGLEVKRDCGEME